MMRSSVSNGTRALGLGGACLSAAGFGLFFCGAAAARAWGAAGSSAQSESNAARALARFFSLTRDVFGIGFSSGGPAHGGPGAARTISKGDRELC
jgi:hypothetical protein